MAGIFIVGQTKIRPGVYSRYENASSKISGSATGGIGGAVIQADWGPLNTMVPLKAVSEIAANFGSALTVGVASEMFNGGCTSVKAVRVGAGGTAATIVLDDDVGVEVVRLTAKFVGARAFSATVRDSLNDVTKRDCIIYSGTTEFEKVSFAKGVAGEPAAIVAAFAFSVNFTATKIADGSKLLATVAQAAMTAGTNPTVTTEDYSTALNVLEAGKWSVVCVDSADADVHALVHAFIERIYETGFLAMACLAETYDIAIATRMTNAAAFNDEKVVYVLNSAYDKDGIRVDGYLLAARIGGMIASVSSDTSLTHTVIDGYVSLAEPLTNGQIEKALANGCLVLSVSSNDQIWIESAINTLVTPSGDQDNGWKKIRRTKTRFELMSRITTATEVLTGKINNDKNGRATFIAAAQGVINDMIGEEKLLEGGTIYVDTNYVPSGDSSWFMIAVDDIDSIEKSYLAYQFRFSAE